MSSGGRDASGTVSCSFPPSAPCSMRSLQHPIIADDGHALRPPAARRSVPGSRSGMPGRPRSFGNALPHRHRPRSRRNARSYRPPAAAIDNACLPDRTAFNSANTAAINSAFTFPLFRPGPVPDQRPFHHLLHLPAIRKHRLLPHQTFGLLPKDSPGTGFSFARPIGLPYRPISQTALGTPARKYIHNGRRDPKPKAASHGSDSAGNTPSRGDRRRRFRRAGGDAIGSPARRSAITLIDRRNHHLFQPLLYQVATASLATSEIAWPIRYLLRDRPEVTTLFANVSRRRCRRPSACARCGDAAALRHPGARHRRATCLFRP